MPTNKRTTTIAGAEALARLGDRAPVPLVAPALTAVQHAIVSCEACPRLRQYCQRIGREKRRAYREDVYWARPVPGFGDPEAQIVLVGLAPAAHGANRTGRVFTGDGAGGSGDFLMAALHEHGLANHAWSRAADDGLTLRNVWMLAAVRCAPPDNRPTPEEIARCHGHLMAELNALPRARVLVALGRIAFEACCRVAAAHGGQPQSRRIFAHGATFPSSDGFSIVASYHPSRQNTQTGRLTPPMLAKAIGLAVQLSASSSGGRRASSGRRTPRPLP